MRQSYIHIFLNERSLLARKTFQISKFKSEYTHLTSQNVHSRSLEATYCDKDTIFY